MTRWALSKVAVPMLVAIAAVSMLQAPASAQGFGAAGPAVDLVLTNGKIITVDDRFSIAQAVAVRGDRIVAVGTNQDIARLAGPNTRRIDLGGRSVVPGLIDNHAHFMEEGVLWTVELRLDGDRYAQAGDRDDAREGEFAPAGPVGVHTRWLVARSVHR